MPWLEKKRFEGLRKCGSQQEFDRDPIEIRPRIDQSLTPDRPRSNFDRNSTEIQLWSSHPPKSPPSSLRIIDNDRILATIRPKPDHDPDGVEVRSDRDLIPIELRSKFNRSRPRSNQIPIKIWLNRDHNSAKFQPQSNQNLTAIGWLRHPIGFRDWL